MKLLDVNPAKVKADELRLEIRSLKAKVRNRTRRIAELEHDRWWCREKIAMAIKELKEITQ